MTALPSLSPSTAASLLKSSVAQAITSRLDFLSLLGEHDRLLQVRTALPALALLPEALHGVESVNAPGLDGFAFELDALSTNAHFELKRLIGEQVTVRLRQQGGSYRALHGYVTAAAQLGGNGGLARYRLSLRSWAAFTALRADSWVFQDQDVRAIVEAVLADHPQAHWEWAATSTLKPRALCTQYNESDAAFIARLLAEEGLAWHFEQLQGDAADAADAKGHARHRLVIHDADSHPQRTHLGTLRFAAAPVVGSFLQTHLQDTLHQFSAERAFTALGVTQASWDPAQLAGVQASSVSHLDVGDMPRLDHYVGQGERRFADALHAQARSDAGVQALELGLKRYQGLGTARHLQAGCQFTLVDHSQFGANTTAFNDAGALLADHKRPDNAFTLTQLQHRARNNLGADMARLLDTPDLAAGHYEVALQAAPAAAPLTPHPPRKPTACGAQVARVVGVPSETLSPDRNLRIKVQFPWQRGQQPNPGGLSNSDDNAPGDHRASAWVRVAQPQAGANWGQHFSPRIGSEVLVGFVEGDIDRPLVVGQLYNAEARPPWSAGEGSGANHPGTLSGLRSQGLEGDGHNHWVLDDTPGQLRTRLMSSHTNAEASLGELIGHNPLSSTRGAWRGTGAELSTQGWGTLRAPQGLLLSASARAGSYGSAQGTQMDSQEALAQLRGARDLGQRLSAASTPAGAAALKSVDAEQALHTAVQDLDPAARGKFPATVDGQSGLQDTSGEGLGRSPADPVPRPARPYVLLDTPSTLVHATQGDVMRLSGLSMSRITQGDQHDTAAHTAVHVAGQQVSLYSHQGQLQVKAAAGPVSIQAHTDALEILADQSVQILSVNDRITISAKNSIEIVAGDSKVTLKGGDVEFSTPGTFEVKSATHNFLGGGSGAAELPALPIGKVTEPPNWIELRHTYQDLEPVQGATYMVTFDDGSVRSGTLDGKGFARIEGVKAGVASVEYGEDVRAWKPPPERRNPDFGAAADAASAAALYEKYFGGAA